MTPSNSVGGITSAHARNRSSQPRIIPAIPLPFSRVPVRPKVPVSEVTPPPTAIQPPSAEATDNAPTPTKSEGVDRQLREEEEDSSHSAVLSEARAEEHDGAVAQETEEARGSDSTERRADDEEKKNDVDTQEPVTMNGTVDRPAAGRKPAELPPPFYPSDTQLTPTSASSSGPPPGFYTENVNQYHPRPSPLVFGGNSEASSTSPAPNSGVMPPYTVPPVAQAFVPHSLPPPTFFPMPAHAHHVSDPYAVNVYPMGMAPQYEQRREPEHHGSHGRAQGSWVQPESALAYDGKPQPTFVPRQSSAQPNGTGVMSSSDIAAKNYRQGEHNTYRSQQQSSNGMYYQPPIRPVDPHRSLHELANWLHHHFGMPQFSDGLLRVHGRSAGSPLLLEFPLHSVITTRSPALQYKSISSGAGVDPGNRVVSLHVLPETYNEFTFIQALRYLYGGELLHASGEQYLPPFDMLSFDTNAAMLARQRMDRALSYMAAGHTLGLPRVSKAGKELVFAALRWDTVDRAIELALTLGQPAPEPTDLVRTPNEAHPSLPDPRLLPEEIVQMILDFLAYSFPEDFILDTDAPQLNTTPRLPTIGDPRPMTHRPRLSQIRFGDVPGPHTYVTTLFSSILLSIPFILLSRFIEHRVPRRRISEAKFSDLVRGVIAQREERRQRVLRSKGFETDPLWQNALWEERVEESTDKPPVIYISRQTQQEDKPLTNGAPGN